MKIIGITGNKQVGKDTVMEYIREDNIVWSYAFATPIYQMLITMLGSLPTKGGSTEIDKADIIEPYGKSLRHMLQTLGTEWGRKCVHEDVWVLHAQKWLEEITKDSGLPDYVVFTDVRFNNEAEFIQKAGGCVVHVIRPDHLPDGHDSEEGIDYMLIDNHILNNSDLPALYSEIDRVLAEL